MTPLMRPHSHHVYDLEVREQYVSCVYTGMEHDSERDSKRDSERKRLHCKSATFTCASTGYPCFGQ